MTAALVIQHHPVEVLGHNLSSALADRGITPETIDAQAPILAGETLPLPPLDYVQLIITPSNSLPHPAIKNNV